MKYALLADEIITDHLGTYLIKKKIFRNILIFKIFYLKKLNYKKKILFMKKIKILINKNKILLNFI